MNENNDKWPELVSGHGSHLAEVKAYYNFKNGKNQQANYHILRLSLQKLR